jgi:hypothetical protein
MHGNRSKQEEANRPQGRPQALQEMGVAVDLVRVTENLEVAHKVPEGKTGQDKAGDRHQDFTADRGLEKIGKETHRKGRVKTVC